LTQPLSGAFNEAAMNRRRPVALGIVDSARRLFNKPQQTQTTQRRLLTSLKPQGKAATATVPRLYRTRKNNRR
jgi:hypothetical protein